MQAPTPATVPKTAEQVYKNLKVLKSVPTDQLIPAMQFITAFSGVLRDFCHNEKAFERDDKDTKQTARKMMRMMFAINKNNFDNHQEVTCFACHRGARKPLVTPAVMEDEGKGAVQENLHQEAEIRALCRPRSRSSKSIWRRLAVPTSWPEFQPGHKRER